MSIERVELPPAVRVSQIRLVCDCCREPKLITLPEAAAYMWSPPYLRVSAPDDREDMHFCPKCAPAIQRAINRECLR